MPASPRARFSLSPPRPKLRVGYIRISTDSGEQLAALDNQRNRIRQAGVDLLIEDVQSGLDSDRPGYQQLLNLMDRRQVASIVITRVDRLSRDAAECDQTIAFAAKRGVQIEALDGGLMESVTPQGFLLTRMATTMAEFESRMLSLRVKRGYEQQRLQHRPARGRCPWGYRVTADGSRLEPNPAEWSNARVFLDVLKECRYRVAPAMRLYEERHGVLQLRSPRGVRGWLANPALRGGLGYVRNDHDTFRHVVWGVVPPLLDPVEWLELEQQLRINRERRGAITNYREHLLTGLCVCSMCGFRMSYNAREGRPLVLICRQLRCTHRNHRVLESALLPQVTLAIRKRLSRHHGRHHDTDEVRALRRQVGRLKGMADEDYRPVLDRKLDRLHELEAQCPDDLLDRMQALYPPSFWAEADHSALRRLYLQAVRQVVVTPPNTARVELRF